jgi:hypothetical protein
MAIKLIIKGTPVELPESGQSPNWAPGIIEAIQALSEAVNSISGTYDVAPQVQNISSFPESSNIEINNLVFPKEEVRAATIFYSVYRKTETDGPNEGQELAEAGTLLIVYNESPEIPINNKWQIQREFVGNANMEFTIDDLGRVKFTTNEMTGIDHFGSLSYRAISILNT